jgi:hypothetical protein
VSISIKNCVPHSLHRILCNHDFFVIDLFDVPVEGNMMASVGHKVAQFEQSYAHLNGLRTAIFFYL